MTTIQEFLKPDLRLPSASGTALRILDAVKHDDFSFAKLGSIIQSDPALTSRILRLANSELYALPRKIGSLDAAMTVLGANTLKNIALSFTLFQAFPNLRTGRFDFDRLWRRSLTSAVAAQLISKEVGFKSDELFITSLLQDIGICAMFLLEPEKYLGVLDEKLATGQPVSVLEKQFYGFDHQEAGGELLKIWGLPETVHLPVRHHHDIDSAPAEIRPLCSVLHVSDRLSAVYHGSGSVKNVRNVTQLLKKEFGLEEDRVSGLIDNVAEKSVELFSRFNIEPGELKPFSQILQEANEELTRLNLSYEMLVIEHKEATQKAQELALELKAANRKLHEAAVRDGLTDIYNHRYFQEALDRELARADRHQRPVGLVMLDIDHFKAVNDAHGHPVGDQVLKTFAKKLVDVSRKSDIVARYGGEEFAIILPETSLLGATIKGEAYRKIMESLQIKSGSTDMHATVSVGVAAYDPQRPASKNKLIECADKALYRSKRDGRNRVTPFDKSTFPEDF